MVCISRGREEAGAQVALRAARVPTHGRFAGVDLLHGDAIFNRADQRAEIAADAFFLDDSRNVDVHALGVLLSI